MANSLMYATQQGDLETVVDIITNQPRLLRERERSLKTALHYSAENRDTSCCEALMTAAPDLVDSRDRDGYTPLHLAVIACNRSLILRLLDRGAEINAVDNDHHTSLHWATVCKDADSVQLLLERGSDANLGDVHGGKPLHYAVQMCGDARVGQAPGENAESDKRTSLSVLKLLILHGAEVNSPDSHGRRPIIWAASAGSPEAILALVNAGCDVEAADNDGLTALHCAASRGHVECINTLIDFCGAEVDVIDTNGCSALFYAVTLGHIEVVLLLLKFGSNPNRQDRKGRTAAHCGAAKGQLDAVKALNRWGGDLWQRSVRGNYPLHEAVASGRSDLLAWLLSQRPQAVNSSNNDGQTLLHIAAARGHVELCQMLVNAGALLNPVMKKRSGDLVTPLDVAINKTNLHLAKVLQSLGSVPITRLTIQSAALTRPSTRALTGMDFIKPKFLNQGKPGEPIIKMRPARENEKKKIQEENQDITVETNDEQILQVFVGEDVEVRRVKSRLRNKRRTLHRSTARKSKKCKSEKVQFSKLRSRYTTRYNDGCEVSTSSAELSMETDYATESDNSLTKASKSKKVGFKLNSTVGFENTDHEKMSSSHEKYDDPEEQIIKADECRSEGANIYSLPDDSEWVVDEQEKSFEPMAQENSSNDTERGNIQIVEAMIHHHASVYVESSASSTEKADETARTSGEAYSEVAYSEVKRFPDFDYSGSKELLGEDMEEKCLTECNQMEATKSEELDECKSWDDSRRKSIESEHQGIISDVSREDSKKKIKHDETEEDKRNAADKSEIDEKTESEKEVQEVENEEEREIEQVAENTVTTEEEAVEVSGAEAAEIDQEEVTDEADASDMSKKEESIGDKVLEDAEDLEKTEGYIADSGEKGDPENHADLLDKTQVVDEAAFRENAEAKKPTDILDGAEATEEAEGTEEAVEDEEKTDVTEEIEEVKYLRETEGQLEMQENGNNKNFVAKNKFEDTSEIDKKANMLEDDHILSTKTDEPTIDGAEDEASSKLTNDKELKIEEMEIQHDDESSKYQEEVDTEAEKSWSKKSVRETDVSLTKNECMDVGDDATLADDLSVSEQDATDSRSTHEATKNYHRNDTSSNSIIPPLEEETASAVLDGTKKDSLKNDRSQDGSLGREESHSFRDESSRRTSKLTGESLEYALEQVVDGIETRNDLSRTEIKSTHKGMSIIFKKTYPYGTGCRQFLDNIQKYKFFHMRNSCKSMAFTQSFQTGMKKFHMERKILSKLIELKHLQMNSKQENETSFVKRLVDSYHKDGLILGIYPYKGATSFRGFEKYLYEQLWLLQRSGKGKRRKEDWSQVDLRDSHCIKITHRCTHTNQTYTELPTAAYKMSVKDGKSTKQGTEESGQWNNEEFSVEVTEGSDERAVTSETSHRHLLTLTLSDNTQPKKT